MAAQITVRPAEGADLPAVAGIFAHYVRHTVATFEETPPDAAAWRRRFDELAGRGLPFLVAEAPEDGRVAGFAYAAPWRTRPAYRHTVEDSIHVAPGRTGRGLGRALPGALLERSIEAGARQMIAVIADSGDGASAALHTRFGFAPAGRLRRVGFEHGRWVDTVLLQRELDGPPGQP
jgi:phosphinothricin acetyltransferase